MSIAKVYASTLCMDNLDKDKFYTECANNNSLKKKRHSRSRERLECGTWAVKLNIRFQHSRRQLMELARLLE